ncbi:MAG: hypothetical protein MJY96_04340 [Bacteroidaceae bacterium]|nr:hypothetical protein [Bacteroidaceae bacterium]
MSSAKGRLSGLLALSPILVFLLVYLLSSVFLGDFKLCCPGNHSLRRSTAHGCLSDRTYGV